MLATYQFMLISRKLLRSLWNILLFFKLNYSRLVCQFSSHCTSWMDKIIQIFAFSISCKIWRYLIGNRWFSLVNWCTWGTQHCGGLLFSLVQVQIQSLNPSLGPKLTLNLPSKPPPTQTFLPEGIVLGSWKFVCKLIDAKLDRKKYAVGNRVNEFTK